MADIEYRFGTGQGEPTVHHSQANVDSNGDGTADGVAVDFDGDGEWDDAMVDSNGDGIADTAWLDLDDDGKAESAYHDPTGMGTWNAKGQAATTPAAEPKPAEPKAEDPPPVNPAPGADPNPGPTTGQSSEYEPYDEADHLDADDQDDTSDNLFDDLMETVDDVIGRDENW